MESKEMHIRLFVIKLLHRNCWSFFLYWSRVFTSFHSPATRKLEPVPSEDTVPTAHHHQPYTRTPLVLHTLHSHPFPTHTHTQQCIFFFFSCQGHTCGMWKFPGQGQNWSCPCQPTPQAQAQPHQTQASSATYTTAHGNAGSLAH